MIIVLSYSRSPLGSIFLPVSDNDIIGHHDSGYHLYQGEYYSCYSIILADYTYPTNTTDTGDGRSTTYASLIDEIGLLPRVCWIEIGEAYPSAKVEPNFGIHHPFPHKNSRQLLFVGRNLAKKQNINSPGSTWLYKPLILLPLSA